MITVYVLQLWMVVGVLGRCGANAQRNVAQVINNGSEIARILRQGMEDVCVARFLTKRDTVTNTNVQVR